MTQHYNTVKQRAYICAALNRYLKTGGQSQRNGEPRLKQMSVRQEKRLKGTESWKTEERGTVSRWGPWRAFVL